MTVLGYRALPTSDPEEQHLRDAWYAAEGAERERIGLLLSKYLWDRTEAQIAEDRRQHPKAKRNQPVPTQDTRPGERNLP